MGYFSWQCTICGQSVKAAGETPIGLEWQSVAVAVMPDGKILHGLYDGYGRIVDDEEDSHDLQAQTPGEWDGETPQGRQLGNPAMWHHQCWEHAGSPTAYTGPALPAEDQGFFCGSGEAEYAEWLADDMHFKPESQKVKP